MDDLTLGGSSRMVAQDVELISNKGAEVGLQLNAGKCEVIYQSSQTHPPSSNVFNSFIRVEAEDCYWARHFSLVQQLTQL